MVARACDLLRVERVSLEEVRAETGRRRMEGR